MNPRWLAAPALLLTLTLIACGTPPAASRPDHGRAARARELPRPQPGRRRGLVISNKQVYVLMMWDDQSTYAAGLVRFLKEINAGRATVAF